MKPLPRPTKRFTFGSWASAARILLITLVISGAALFLFQVEASVLDHPVIEALVIAILLGMVWRMVAGLPARAKAGVKFASKPVLEMAIVLLGASVNLTVIVGAGVPLIASVIIAVILSLTISTALGRALGLKPKLATLVAVGNSICGNSAIGAIAPVIDAEPDDITSSIALANVLGVAEIFLLPSLIAIFGLTFYQYGILAGLSGYAVPQVVAATFSVSAVSGEIGTMVKLMRVLLLGPVALFYSLRYPRPVRRRTRQCTAKSPVTFRGSCWVLSCWRCCAAWARCRRG